MTAITTTEIATEAADATATVLSIDELMKQAVELQRLQAETAAKIKQAQREQAERERAEAAKKAEEEEAKRGPIMGTILAEFTAQTADILAAICEQNGLSVTLPELAKFMHINREKKVVARLTEEQIVLIKRMFEMGIPAAVIEDAMKGTASYATIAAHGEKVQHGVIKAVGPDGKTWQTGKRGAIPQFAQDEIVRVLQENFPELNIQRADSATA